MKVVRQVYIYFGSYFFNAAVSFLTLSLLTNHLSPYDYGIINLYSSFLIFLMPFITGGVLVPLSVDYFKKDADSYRTYFTNAQVIPLISLCLFSLFCLIAGNYLAGFLRVSLFWVYLLPLTAWFIYINETSMTIARNKNLPWLYAGFSVGKNLAEMLLTIVLVIGLGWGWQGRFSSALLAPFLLFFISIYFFYRWRFLSSTIDWKMVKMICLLSIPFIFERLSIFVLGNSDKYFIDKFDLRGTAEVGLYGLASQIASIVFLVILSLNSAYHPYLFKKLSDGKTKGFHRSTWLYIAVCAIVVLGLFIALPVLFRYFIGDKFQDALPYTYILTGGYFMWGIYNAFYGYLIFMSKNRQILYTAIAGMCFSLLLNSSLVPSYGATGAAVTSILTYSVMALISFLYVRKYFILKKE